MFLTAYMKIKKTILNLGQFVNVSYLKPEEFKFEPIPLDMFRFESAFFYLHVHTVKGIEELAQIRILMVVHTEIKIKKHF